MLAGKVIAITGAARGIGREMALMAASEGARVVVNDLGVAPDGRQPDASAAEATVAEIMANGGQAVANAANIGDPEGAQSIIDDAVEAFGRIDGVINNAGFLRDRMFYNLDRADWDDIINVHLNGYFYVSRAAATRFREQGSGAYVHFTSTSAMIGNIGQSSYAAAKAGVIGMSTSIALDMKRYNVRSNCISPFAWSRLAATMASETEEDKIRVKRFQSMSAAKIAPLAVFLVSDAAKDVNAQVFCVRKDEIFLFAPQRPVRSIHRDGGWSPATVAEHMLPAFRPSFHDLEVSSDVFAWDPI
ncbi:SDR family NAD(P)-dependent oxidoreductase [Novosphingobium mangrovi (ex Huang et al. 2023)]|uniref:SDR family oxidoreductase n=1 Tax=Novosphingobium mangrovi (ex Huang et al. 2023) TaxID=2976432 RepID=A0ABT2I9G6_9SPHN|nr:SDR family NAD(P)-dependent oxidoreductase [Novosphingobium mangrovi (ex Huang et al. 2023)]MCT2401203.1 SDR family oxidoreductase [Novosphingobium mangrovi (ex Huang et al. 2023)]